MKILIRILIAVFIYFAIAYIGKLAQNCDNFGALEGCHGTVKKPIRLTTPERERE